MNAPLLEVSALSRSFGGIAAASELSLQVVHGEVHAIIGPNGAGKTTLVSLLAGELRPDSGSIRFCGETITAMPVHARAQRGLARTFQITSIFPEFSAVGNVAMAVQAHANHSFRFWRPVAADMALRQRALEVLQQVGLADAPDRNAGEMSHGEHRLLEMAMALATRPALLLLDEPAAGLGPGGNHCHGCHPAKTQAGQGHLAGGARHGRGFCNCRPDHGYGERPGYCDGQPAGDP